MWLASFSDQRGVLGVVSGSLVLFRDVLVGWVIWRWRWLFLTAGGGGTWITFERGHSGGATVIPLASRIYSDL